MSQLPYLNSPNPMEDITRSFSIPHSPGLVSSTFAKQSSPDTPIPKSAFSSIQGSHSEGRARKMQTTVAVRERDPHRFRVFPLKQVRESLQGPSSRRFRSTGDACETELEEAMRRKRNMSAGSTPFAMRKATHNSLPVAQAHVSERAESQADDSGIFLDTKWTESTDTDGVAPLCDSFRAHKHESSTSSIQTHEVIRMIRDTLARTPGRTTQTGQQPSGLEEESDELGPLVTPSSRYSVKVARPIPGLDSENRISDSRQVRSRNFVKGFAARRRSQTVSEVPSRKFFDASSADSSSIPVALRNATGTRHSTVRRHAIYAGSDERFACFQLRGEDDDDEQTSANIVHSTLHLPSSDGLASNLDENRTLLASSGMVRHNRSSFEKDVEPTKHSSLGRSRLVLADLDPNALPPHTSFPARLRQVAHPVWREDSRSVLPWTPLNINKRRPRDSLDAVVHAGLMPAATETLAKDPFCVDYSKDHHPIVLELLSELDLALATWKFGVSYI
ncbi:uncharacterized protein FIBRA_08127 [Fibroporia radiculosa]|uniref:Uncharacterized protein n=1 Tax=Fibroporia radiculosa TaxID=599839 RepID=J4H503_9APHY|nr:uncharacterized protein FIBRA_08127 [Fibroporia radiculosa]CCM05889.1 predicted protein [Fibroporia radiculosa]